MYQLDEYVGNDAGASNKARSDIRIIAEKIGFLPIQVKTVLGKGGIKPLDKLSYLLNLRQALKHVDDNSTMLVQIPVLNLADKSHRTIKEYALKKKLKIVCIIHDVNDIRSNLPPDSNKDFYNLLKIAKAIISHNQKMTDYLVLQGIEREKIINLELFDYLLDKEKKGGNYSKTITIAGNLDPDKVGYLRGLKELNDVSFELYGPNFRKECGSTNIIYKGVVKSSELPFLLKNGFGLVWDGKTIETCDGNYGNYLRYNNPHKLSLYLAAGLPVIVWSESAEAPFVELHHIGICVDSLREISAKLAHISEKEYDDMQKNISLVQKKLSSGSFASEALEKSLCIVEKSRG